MSKSVPDCLDEAVVETIAANPEMVRRWSEQAPGAWGYLAGQGVLAYRRRLGRHLSDAERRALWQALWSALDHAFGKGDSAGGIW